MGKDIVRAGYNAIAAEYTTARRENIPHPSHFSFLQDFADRLSPNAAILDAGCGAGIPVAHWLSERFMVTGVDFSQEQIDLARQLVPKATFLCQDMTALNVPDASFDAVCSFYAMIHIPREEHEPLLHCFHRMLRPCGLLLLCMGATEWPGEVEDFFGTPMYWSHFDAATNLRMVEKAGFNMLRHEIVPDNLDPGIASNHLFLLAEKPPTSG